MVWVAVGSWWLLVYLFHQLHAVDGISKPVPISEVYALNTFYDALNGDDWLWRETSYGSQYGSIWNFTGNISLVNPCSSDWQGISCNCSLVCNIVQVNLNNYGLQGILPDMQNLTMLESLDLYHNLMLEGELQALSTLTSLSAIYIGDTAISGDLQALSTLTSLSIIDLDSTAISGDLQTLSTLTSLSTMSLFDTAINGDLQALSTLTSLSVIYLGSTAVSGDLRALSTLTSLSEMSLFDTAISGDLQALSTLTSLSAIDLDNTAISGELQALRTLTSLSYISLDSTAISGELQALSTLTSLSTMSLFDTAISGELQALSTLTSLSAIDLDNTAISGELRALSTLTSLSYISLDSTAISGELQALSTLTSLSEISLSDTAISGDLRALSTLTSLSVIDLDNTAVSGDLRALIPLTSLRGFSVDDTAISGDLRALSTLTSLSIIDLDSTAVSGDLRALSTLTSLSSISLSDTAISGDLRALSTLTSLSAIDLDNTAVSGDLRALSTLNSLSEMSLSSTAISGNLNPLQLLHKLEYCLLNNNALTGSIPSFSNSSLVYLNVESNYLGGPLQAAGQFPDSLVILDIANNILTGVLPDALLGLPNLQVLDASINCLTLKISDKVCESDSLEYLLLDGLHSAGSCRSTFPINIYDTIYQPQSAVVTDVPPCLYSISQLRYLHLSGNGITGSLPENAVLSSNFIELVLANNDFRSTIPSSFLAHNWKMLDLSYNRFTGGLSSSMNVSVTVSLKKNRLSGDIPSSLYATSYVSILTGNMFDCTEDQLSQLHDEVGNRYTCGSSSFNNISYLWLSVIIVGCALLSLMYLYKGRDSQENSVVARNTICRYAVLFADIVRAKKANVISAMSALESIGSVGSISQGIKPLPNIIKFTDFMKAVRRASGALTGVVVFVFTPLYTVLSDYCGSYYHQYAWTASAAFLSGLNVGVILFVVYIVSLLSLCYYYRSKIESMLVQTSSGDEVRTSRGYLAACCVLFVVNLIVIVAVNILYVFIFLEYSQVVVTVTGIFVSAIKLGWTNYALKFLLESLEGTFVNSIASESHDNSHFLSILVIMNSVLIPCLASALINVDCFYNLLVSPDDIKSTFEVSDTFGTTTTTTIVTTSITTSSNLQYTPSFVYSYQCSSVILTSYSTVFMYSALFAAILPTITNYLKPKVRSQIKNVVGGLVRAYGSTSDRFIGTDFALSLLGSVLILISFGVMAPVLGCVTFLSIVAQTLYMEYRLGVYVRSLLKSVITRDDTAHRISIGVIRVDSNYGHDSAYVYELQLLDTELARIDQSIFLSTWQMLIFLGPFYGLFIFDIVGDELGYRQALWAPITFVLICLFVFITPFFLQQYHRMSKQAAMARRSGSTINNIELASTSASSSLTTVNPINSEFG